MPENPKNIDQAAPRRLTRWRTRLVEITLITAMCLLLISILLPSYSRWSNEHSGRPRCGSNLRQIGQAAYLYAVDHGNRFPDGIEGLVEQDITTAVFVCPYTSDTPAKPGPTTRATAANVLAGGHCSYVYVGKGLTTQSGADTVLAYEPMANHQNAGMNVVYCDGHVDFVEAKVATKVLAELNVGHNPPRAEELK